MFVSEVFQEQGVFRNIGFKKIYLSKKDELNDQYIGHFLKRNFMIYSDQILCLFISPFFSAASLGPSDEHHNFSYQVSDCGTFLMCSVPSMAFVFFFLQNPLIAFLELLPIF
jgi:hypothetical protein